MGHGTKSARGTLIISLTSLATVTETVGVPRCSIVRWISPTDGSQMGQAETSRARSACSSSQTAQAASLRNGSEVVSIILSYRAQFIAGSCICRFFAPPTPAGPERARFLVWRRRSRPQRPPAWLTLLRPRAPGDDSKRSFGGSRA